MIAKFPHGHQAIESFLRDTRIVVRVTPLGERILEHLSLAAVCDSAA